MYALRRLGWHLINCDTCFIYQMEKEHAIKRYKIQIFLPLLLPAFYPPNCWWSPSFPCAVYHSALLPAPDWLPNTRVHLSLAPAAIMTNMMTNLTILVTSSSGARTSHRQMSSVISYIKCSLGSRCLQTAGQSLDGLTNYLWARCAAYTLYPIPLL